MKKTTKLVYQHLFWRGLYILSLLGVNIGIARFFAAEQSGQIFFIVNNLALILLVVSISLESGSTYYLSIGELDVGSIARFCMVWAIVASLCAIAGWWGYLQLSHSAYLDTNGFLPASFLFIVGVLYTTFFTALYYASKEFGIPNKILLSINLLMIAILVAFRTQNWFRIHFIEIYFLSFFLQGSVLAFSFFSKYGAGDRSRFPPKSILVRVIKFSLLALLANLIYFFVNRIDYWFVKYYCSAADLGNYIQASKLAQMLFILPSIMGATLFPVFASSTKKDSNPKVAAVMRVMFLINGIICVVVVCLGWFLIPMIFGSSFRNMYFLFVLLIPGIISVTMNYPLAAWFSANHRIKMNIWGSLLALIVICCGNFMFLPSAGVAAAAVVSSVGYFCYYCYMIIRFREENLLSWKELLWIKKSDFQAIKQSLSAMFREPIPENPIF